MGSAMTEEDDSGRDRTNLAEDRTVLANERTFAGWLRTALACVGLGVAFHALFEQMEPSWAPKAIASVFIVTGLMIMLLGERNARKILNRLSTHSIKPVRGVNLLLVTAMVVTGSLTLLAGIWLLV